MNYDPTGISIANKIVDEELTITTTKIELNEGVFFTNSFIIKGKLSNETIYTELVHGTDYTLSPNFKEESDKISNELASFIILTDFSLYNTVQVTYQALGDNRVDNVLNEEILNLDTFDLNNVAIWSSLTGQKSTTSIEVENVAFTLSKYVSKLDKVVNKLRESETYLNNGERVNLLTVMSLINKALWNNSINPTLGTQAVIDQYINQHISGDSSIHVNKTHYSEYNAHDHSTELEVYGDVNYNENAYVKLDEVDLNTNLVSIAEQTKSPIQNLVDAPYPHVHSTDNAVMITHNVGLNDEVTVTVGSGIAISMIKLLPLDKAELVNVITTEYTSGVLVNEEINYLRATILDNKIEYSIDIHNDSDSSKSDALLAEIYIDVNMTVTITTLKNVAKIDEIVYIKEEPGTLVSHSRDNVNQVNVATETISLTYARRPNVQASHEICRGVHRITGRMLTRNLLTNGSNHYVTADPNMGAIVTRRILKLVIHHYFHFTSGTRLINFNVTVRLSD